MKTDHYVIARIPDRDRSRLVLGRVTSLVDGTVYGYEEQGCHLRKESWSAPLTAIVADLGPDPEPGTVYGRDTSSIYRGSVESEDWGRLFFFYRVKNDVKKKILAGFAEAGEILRKNRLPIPEDCVWEVHGPEARGRWAGSYKHSSREGEPSIFTVKPESIPDGDFVYVVLHEYAHWIHRNHMGGDRLNAAWIRLFNTSVAPQAIELQTVRALLEDLVRGETLPSDFRSGLDEESAEAYRGILKTVKADHAVGMQELDTLFTADSRDQIEKLWPNRALSRRELSSIVSEYATVSYHELIAESISFFLTGKKLPERITKLVDRSLSHARAQKN